MSTDAGTGMETTSQTTSLSAELEKAAALLKREGLDHAAAQLLAPEASGKVEKAVEPKVEVRGRAAAKALAVASKVRKAAKAKKVRKVAKAKMTKAKTKVAKAETAKTKHKPVSGQSGPRIAELVWDDLNKKERLVVGCFDLEGEREVRTIEQIGAEAFKSQTLKKQNSWTRNSLRRLMRSGKWLEKAEPGKYRLTQWARTSLRG